MDEIFIHILTGVFLIVVGLLVKRFPMLIAGYNTMPAEKKKNVDVAGLSSFMRRHLVIIGALWVLLAIVLNLTGQQDALPVVYVIYLPVYVGILTAREYVPYEKVLTKTEVSDAADRYLNEYMQNLTEKGIQILGSDVKIERSGSHWKIHGTLTVVEDITKSSPIPEDQEEIQTLDEHH